MENLTSSDKKTRKWWLIFSLIPLGIFGIIGAFFLLVLFVKTLLGLEVLKNIITMMSILFISMLVFGLFWLFYECSYKKHGTKLLYLYLILIPFFLLVDFLKMFSGKENSILFSFLLFAYSILCYVMHFKLLQVNKRIRSRKVGSDEFQNLLSLLKASWHPEELEQTFITEFQKNPSIEKPFFQEYKARKKLLEDISDKKKVALEIAAEEIKKEIQGSDVERAFSKFTWVIEAAPELKKLFDGI